MELYKNNQYIIYNASCLDVMDSLEENSIDAIVTDPPYEIDFMSKKWDNTGIAFSIDTWKKCLRVLKPGGHLLAFNHSRTFHRMAVAIEDAGFQIRDTIMWLYGSGFPKSHDISKGIDKKFGAEREAVGKARGAGTTGVNGSGNQTFVAKNKYDDGTHDITSPSTPQAKQWQGYGSSLKPAHEPIILARKPFKGTIADNILQHGVGGLNIDGCRVGVTTQDEYDLKKRPVTTGIKHDNLIQFTKTEGFHVKHGITNQGRFPANLIHDGSEEATKGMWDWEVDSDASRYFYTAKASKRDRDEGLGSFDVKKAGGMSGRHDGSFDGNITYGRNIHPTVKPTDLMQYLVRLITPPNGKVLDPFMGSGSTGKACMIENVVRGSNYQFIGIDLEKEYCDIAKARIEYGINYVEEKEKERKDLSEGQTSIFDILEG